LVVQEVLAKTSSADKTPLVNTAVADGASVTKDED
jgi:hypothetical protein